MDYIFGSLYILKSKLWYIDFNSVPRIRPKLPWYEQYKYFYSESNEIINNLYLGSSFNAYSINELTNKNINVIINVTEEIDNFHENNLDLTYYKILIKDNNQDDIRPVLEETYNIIDHHLEKGDSILVHCYMGASRSAAVVINYLMRKNSISYEQAYKIVSGKRSLVNLSEKFDEILKFNNIRK